MRKRRNVLALGGISMVLMLLVALAMPVVAATSTKGETTVTMPVIAAKSTKGEATVIACYYGYLDQNWCAAIGLTRTVLAMIWALVAYEGWIAAATAVLGAGVLFVIGI